MQAPVTANRLGRSPNQNIARGKAKSGSVAISVFAIDTSKCLIAASDSQNPPKVTTTTARANLARNAPCRSGCSQQPIFRWDKPNKSIPENPNAIRRNVPSRAETSRKPSLATIIDTAIERIQSRPKTIPVCIVVGCSPPRLSPKRVTLTPPSTRTIPIQARRLGSSPSTNTAISTVTAGPNIMIIINWCAPRRWSAAKKNVSPAEMPNTPLNANQPSALL